MLLYLWIGQARGISATLATCLELASHVPDFLVAGAGLLMVRAKTPAGRPRSVVLAGVLVLLGVILVSAIFSGLVVYGTIAPGKNGDYLVYMTVALLLRALQILGYGLLFGVLVRSWRQIGTRTRGIGIAALACLLGAAALWFLPLLMIAFFGSVHYFSDSTLLLLAPTLLWVVGFALLLCALIRALQARPK